MKRNLERHAKIGHQNPPTVTELMLTNHCMLKKVLVIIITAVIQIMNHTEPGVSQLTQTQEWSTVTVTN